MNDLQKEIMRVLDLHELGKPIYAKPGKDGISRADFIRSEPEPLRAPLRQAEPQSLEKTMQDIPAVAGGIAGGVGVGLGEAADLGIGLLEGAYKALNPDAGEGRFQSFVSGLAEQFETGYGEQARSIVMDMGEKAGLSPEQLDVMDESITAGSMLSIGGATKKAAQAVPGMMSKAGDVIEGAGEGAKARMAEGGVTLGAGVDPDPLIAAAGDAVKAMRGGDGQFLSLLEKDVRSEYPDVDLDIYGDSQKGYTLSKIIIPKEKRKQGMGKQVMSRIVDAADQEGAVVKLTPSKDFGATSTARLKKFYKQFGFVENKGRYKDFSIKETMYRLPRDAETNASIKPPTEKEPGIIAFHGSGADFDEFKLEKIGTGEGAQAYGYGLYFTDSEDIAKFYRDTVQFSQRMRGNTLNINYQGKPFEDLGDTAAAEAAPPSYTAIKSIADEMARYLPANPKMAKPELAKERLLARIDAQIEKYSKAGQPDADVGAIELQSGGTLEELMLADLQQQKQALLDINSEDIQPATGKMYKVGLEPKPEDMLDYQATFADQPKNVQDALKAIGYEVETNRVGQKNPQAQIDLAMRRPMPMILDSLKGRIIENIEAGKQDPGPADKILSEKLLEQGVPGVKYRAAGSRGASVDAADAEMNYVIFDDKMIKILEKYGIVGPVAITGIAASQQEGEGDGRSA